MPIFGGVRRVRLRPATTPAVYRFERLSAQANAFLGGVTTGCPVASAPPLSSAARWPTAADLSCGALSRLAELFPASAGKSAGQSERRRQESARPQLVAGTIRALRRTVVAVGQLGSRGRKPRERCPLPGGDFRSGWPIASNLRLVPGQWTLRRRTPIHFVVVRRIVVLPVARLATIKKCFFVSRGRKPTFFV